MPVGSMDNAHAWDGSKKQPWVSAFEYLIVIFRDQKD